MGGPAEWRKPDILADATVELCCADLARVTGRAFFDEDVLSEFRSLSGFGTYSVVPGTTPAPVCREMVE
jgi:hypothetical protein